MVRLFHEHHEAIAETEKLLARITFSLDELRYNYPEETIGNGETAQQTLERLARAGALQHYPDGVPERVQMGLEHERQLIVKKQNTTKNHTKHDLVRFAREERGILCQ